MHGRRRGGGAGRDGREEGGAEHRDRRRAVAGRQHRVPFTSLRAGSADGARIVVPVGTEIHPRAAPGKPSAAPRPEHFNGRHAPFTREDMKCNRHPPGFLRQRSREDLP
ncbi:hypothetical protein GCM10010286_42100 [Streptomyces toxytricini]|nr:hypothetical protein GCM10010286_42100 [Streptomyces toxytricini]